MNPHLNPGRQHYGLTLAVLLIAALAFALQQTMVAPALPAIQEELGYLHHGGDLRTHRFPVDRLGLHSDHRPARRHVRQGADARDRAA